MEDGLDSRPLPTGLVVATPGALRLLEEHATNHGGLLAWHQSGAWGALCAEDRKMNECNLREDARLFSVFVGSFRS